VVEIREVKTHFALSGRGDFDQSAAQGEALERAAEHHAADQIEDNVRALVPGRRANFHRQVRGASIRVPTLVFHRTEDVWVSVEGGRELAAGIPGARLVEFPGTAART
jgi:pimeloyl-ACP methyl ester carboxylesterase